MGMASAGAGAGSLKLPRGYPIPIITGCRSKGSELAAHARLSVVYSPSMIYNCICYNFTFTFALCPILSYSQPYALLYMTHNDSYLGCIILI